MDAVHRDEFLQAFLALPLEQEAEASLSNLVQACPTSCNGFQYHWLSYGATFCQAGTGVGVRRRFLGRLVLALRKGPLALASLRPNVAHEFSHPVRMLQKPQGQGPGRTPYTVRDYLIFEGLASVLAELQDPTIPPESLDAGSEAALWEEVHLGSAGFEAYAPKAGHRSMSVVRPGSP